MSELLLLSGGIDSIALAAWRRPSLCLTIDYGQAPAAAEFTAAKQVCKDLGLQWQGLTIPIRELGAGDLASEAPSRCSDKSEFWPFRNQFLITVAAMAAIKNTCSTVLVGTVSTDNRHVDGSAAFIEKLDAVLNMQEGALMLDAPAKGLSSVELIQRSKISMSVLGWAHSCHLSNLACGSCAGCIKHTNVMQEMQRRDKDESSQNTICC